MSKSYLSEPLNSDNSIIDLMLLDPDCHVVDVPRKVGFDRIKVSMRVLYVDFSVLNIVLSSESGLAEKTLSVTSCRDDAKILRVCEGEPEDNWYSSIRIRNGASSFNMRRCNIEGASDICIYEVCIPPLEGHEVLGNISNLSCTEMQDRVRYLMEDLERYGIYVDREIAILKSAELNINVYMTAQHHGFMDVIEILGPYRHGLEKFGFSDFSEKEKDRKYGMWSNNAKQLWSLDTGVTKRRRTSSNSQIGSIKIKIYDKSRETEKKLYDKELEERKRNRVRDYTRPTAELSVISPLTRIEFLIDAPNQVRNYFQKENLFDMTQQDILAVWTKLADKFIIKPLLIYYRKMDYAFEQYFKGIDIQKKGWRSRTVMDLDRIIKEMDDYFIITQEALGRYVSCIPGKTIKTNKAKIVKSLCEEFKNAACILITEEDVVDIITKWLRDRTIIEPQNIIYYYKPLG